VTDPETLAPLGQLPDQGDLAGVVGHVLGDAADHVRALCHGFPCDAIHEGRQFLTAGSNQRVYRSDVVGDYTLRMDPLPMRLSRPRFTVRRLMVAVAIVASELGCGLFLQREVRQPDSRMDLWSETVLNLAFLNLLISGPACIFACVLYQLRRNWKPRKDR
jgi:hypothetical protein